MPFAFTEQGVAMLSSILNSEIAIQVNIQIIRVYTRMRQFFLDNEELRKKIEAIEKNLVKKDEEIQTIFKILKELLVQETPPARNQSVLKFPKGKTAYASQLIDKTILAAFRVRTPGYSS